MAKRKAAAADLNSEKNPSTRASKRKALSKTNGTQSASNGENGSATIKKQILLNAFDMSTVGHLSPGQWKVSFQSAILNIVNANRN